MRCGERLTGEGDGKIKCNAEGGRERGKDDEGGG